MKRTFLALLFVLVSLPCFGQYRNYGWLKDVVVPYPDGDLSLHVNVYVFQLSRFYPDYPPHVTVGGWIYTTDLNANTYRVIVRWRTADLVPRTTEQWISAQFWPMLDGTVVHGLDRYFLALPADCWVDEVTVEKIRAVVTGAATVTADDAPPPSASLGLSPDHGPVSVRPGRAALYPQAPATVHP